MDTTRPSLLLRIRDRSDADAWRTFDTIYRPMIFRFVKAHGLSDADAEDITQFGMTTVQKHIGQFTYDPQKGRFKAWLRTLVRNRVRNFLRDRHDFQAGTGAFDRRQVREPQPEETFDRIWKEEHLWYCMRSVRAEVEEMTYQAFELYVIKQWPVEKVCAELGLSSNNVYTIKWRMTERIAERMRELLDGPE